MYLHNIAARHATLWLGAVALLAYALPTAHAQPGPDEVRMREAWRTAIEHRAPPGTGCFHAAYPGLAWVETACTRHIAHQLPHLSVSQRLALKRQMATGTRNVGDGIDDMLDTGGALIATATGSFPAETGVTSETNPGSGGKNAFSLQLNTNFMSGDAKCAGKGKCQGWQQFYFGTGPASIAMQAWVIDYGGDCKAIGTSWGNGGNGDCYYTSKEVDVPKLLPTDLTAARLTASATSGGNDTVTWTTSTDAYSVSQPDSTVYASQGWTKAEFNVVGNYGDTIATFNSGSSLTVKITDGLAAAPTCYRSDGDGSTGEQNNLNLGTCTPGAGEITFTESN